MKTNIRPRRSVLYMPGANDRALEKAKSLSADAVILDLEDSVAPEAKVQARERGCAGGWLWPPGTRHPDQCAGDGLGNRRSAGGRGSGAGRHSDPEGRASRR